MYFLSSPGCMIRFRVLKKDMNLSLFGETYKKHQFGVMAHKYVAHITDDRRKYSFVQSTCYA